MLGQFRIEFIKTNHSIQDASALAIYSPAGIVIHTGDFKVDYTPVFGDAIDLQRFAEIGKKGVLALDVRQYQCRAKGLHACLSVPWDIPLIIYLRSIRIPVLSLRHLHPT